MLSALIGLAWLAPNHYYPWLAAWSDAIASVGLLALLFVAFTKIWGDSDGKVSLRLFGFVALSLVVLFAQFAFGKLHFVGDAATASLYLLLWIAALLTGRLGAAPRGTGRELNAVAATWVLAAILSVGIALVQWTGALNLGIYAADLPPGGRPFANLAQPNNFSTVCFIGLCALLWLHQLRRVSGAALWLGVGFLLLGMVTSQSRTGWLQIGLLVVWGLAMQKRASLRITRPQLLVLGAIFAAGVLLWPAINDILLLSVSRSLDDQLRESVRLPYWRMMIDAIGREPLWGYGWQQVGAAQQRVALDYPSVGAHFEHAHNIVLDLLLWNGLPAGGLIVALLAWWFIAHIRACRDARVAWLLAMVGGVVTHGMLELPLEYAYFLIPVGLAMGAVDGISTATGPSLHLPRWLVLSFAALLMALFAWVAVDYLKAEESHRTLRVESARIGVSGIVTPAPRLHLLTQLDAFLQFAHTEAKPGMTADQMDFMRKVSERFGYPPVMFRYALAAGLNGQPEIASQTLARLCRIHPRERCEEAREGWGALQRQYPQLTNVTVPGD